MKCGRDLSPLPLGSHITPIKSSHSRVGTWPGEKGRHSLLMSLETSIEKLEGLSIVRLREASCLALVLLSYCLFLVVQLLTSCALNHLFPGIRRWGSGLLQRPYFQCALSQVNLYGLKPLPCLARVRDCPGCRAPGGCWMPLPTSEKVDKQPCSRNYCKDILDPVNCLALVGGISLLLSRPSA